MISKAFSLTALAVSAAALVAACGGGGGSEAAATPSVQLSGVAATGLALANSAVDVKCASGTGTATTNGNGAYTVTVENGALPCIVKVTGTANGVPVTLHSIAQGGTASGSTTTATANVTPLTEMILARAAGTLPSDLFTNFGTGSAVPAATLTQATTDVLTALGTAAGVDLSAIADPFQASLVAATETNLSGGNAYDQLLDQLGAVVSPASLPQVVSQIASTTGSTAPVTLNEVVANVKAGSLEGCPQALSGKYRVIDYDGDFDEVELNFGTMLVNGEITMTRSSTQPCELTVNDLESNPYDGPTTVVFGPAGAGVVRDKRILAYIFPVQSHSLASVTGKKWEFVEAGIDDATAAPNHWIGEMDIAADGKVTVCDYVQLDFTTCEAETEEAVSLTQSGSTLLLNYGGIVSPMYGFRAPNGSLTLFGRNQLSDGLRTSFILTQPKAYETQSVGTELRFWNVIQRFVDPNPSDTVAERELSTTFGQGSATVTASTPDSVTRTFPNNTTDTWQLNKPISGLRTRTAADGAVSYQRNLPGLGITIGIDGGNGSGNAHVHSVAISRPAP